MATDAVHLRPSSYLSGAVNRPESDVVNVRPGRVLCASRSVGCGQVHAVAVPERSIGSSFAKTNLKEFGFFANWEPKDEYNLCTPGADGSKSKVQAFVNFINSDEKLLICTHATFRFAFNELGCTKSS